MSRYLFPASHKHVTEHSSSSSVPSAASLLFVPLLTEHTGSSGSRRLQLLSVKSCEEGTGGWLSHAVCVSMDAESLAPEHAHIGSLSAYGLHSEKRSGRPQWGTPGEVVRDRYQYCYTQQISTFLFIYFFRITLSLENTPIPHVL